jgi:hypothetical protein
MNRIMLTCLLLVATSAFGQDRGKVSKKPDVTLSGDPSAPTITNNTDRHIIAYSLRRLLSSELHFQMRGHGPFVPAHSKRALNDDTTTQVATRDGDPSNPIMLVEAVVFDDGEVVAIDGREVDVASVFERMDARVRAEKDLHQKLLQAYGHANTLVDKTQGRRETDAAWKDVEAAKERTKRGGYTAAEDRYVREQEKFAEELLRVKNGSGEAAAIELAKTSANYPKIWRKK